MTDLLDASPPAIAADREPDGSPFILLVDDHGPCLERMREVVELTGLPSVAASSGADALACCDARRPSCVVTDLSMPVLDGSALARWLHARYPDLPIILVTGQDLDARARSTLGPAFAAMFPKPVDPALLLDTLGRLVRSCCDRDDGPEGAGTRP
ncbi:MAG TPA: response regulator [Isosphaeraceae bacterium]|nr:response regulator [Isosphaeraceae bacterium]